ncbi:MAG: acyl-CoA thioesterase, partial [Planctomycetes bacterium]|nr:acyl-CoA thioesterase [Planctomycetota bacterium]
MPAIMEWTHTVVEEDLDGLGHANNISYLKWMQSAALAHSAAQGWPHEAYAAIGCGWVVRTHFIEYLTPALLGDPIIVRTWVSEMKKVTSLRKFLIVKANGENENSSNKEKSIFARAETNWAFIDYQTGAP